MQSFPAIAVELIKISQPGFLPPIQAGINAAQCEIVAFIDDDAEAYPDWLEQIERCYADPSVGGVGGRVVNVFDGQERKYEPAKVFGKFHWYGRIEGNLYKDGAGELPIEVDCFMGGNMSYRKAILNKISVDMNLNNAVAANYEIDLGLQAKEMGYRLLYAPMAKVNHFSAGHTGDSPRKDTKETFYWLNFNRGYLVAKHVYGVRLFCVLIYEFFIGQFMTWGLLSALWFVMKHRKNPEFLFQAIFGRIAGIKAALTLANSRSLRTHSPT